MDEQFVHFSSIHWILPYIHIYIKFEPDLIDHPQVYFIFVDLLEEVVWREEYVVLQKENVLYHFSVC